LSQDEQDKLKDRIREKDFEANTASASSSATTQTDDASQVQAAAPSESAAVNETLRSENEVLKTQLENAQKLTDACSLKIDELEHLIEKNNELTEKLEDQNEEYEKLNNTLEEKVEKFQTAEDMYNDTLDSAN